MNIGEKKHIGLGNYMEYLRKFGSGGGIRTPDPVVNSHSLCRMSYAGSDFIKLYTEATPYFN